MCARHSAIIWMVKTIYMNDPEEFLKRYKQMPRDIEAAQQQDEHNAARGRVEYADRLEQEKRARAQFVEKQKITLQQVYEQAGMKARATAIASLISNGRILHSSVLNKPIYNSEIQVVTFAFEIPYEQFNGKKIIPDESLSTPGHNAGMHGWISGATGQKLSQPEQIINSLNVTLSYEHSQQNAYSVDDTNDSVKAKIFHLRWRKEEMRWTKAWFEKTGWVSETRAETTEYFKFQAGQITLLPGHGALEASLDRAFDYMYRDYLESIGRV
jgi:hypothetical protein